MAPLPDFVGVSDAVLDDAALVAPRRSAVLEAAGLDAAMLRMLAPSDVAAALTRAGVSVFDLAPTPRADLLDALDLSIYDLVEHIAPRRVAA